MPQDCACAAVLVSFLMAVVCRRHSNKTSRALRVVQNRAFIQDPFSASRLGVCIGALEGNLAKASAALVHSKALPRLQFAPTSIADNLDVAAALTMCLYSPLLCVPPAHSS
jgi:hypothetical protein